MSERTFADKKGGKNRLMVRLAVTGLINTLHINLKIEKKKKSDFCGTIRHNDD